MSKFGILPSALALTLLASVATTPVVTKPAAAVAADGLAAAIGLSWSNGGVRVSWPADGKPNLLRATDAQGTVFEQPVPAAAANELVLPVSRFPSYRDLTITVFDRESDSATAAGATIGQTPVFDTDRPEFPVVTRRQPNGNGTLSLGWNLVRRTDSTPGDPLDRPVVAAATPYLSNRVGCGWTALPTVTGSAGTTTVAARPRPYRVFLRASNEWGPADTKAFEVADYAVSAKVTPATNYGSYLRFAGRLEVIRPGRCAEGVTQPVYRVEAVGRLQLQARNDVNSAWSTINPYLDTEPDGTFWATQANPGRRQYRAVMASSARAELPGFGDVAAFVAGSTPVTSSAFHVVRRARIDYPSATYGSKVSALLGVAPGTNARATLQRWNGTSWVSVKWVQLTNGSGSYSFTAAPRGVSAFRYIVPGAFFAGRYISGITTETFRMTVR
ncbi:hypothetical protein [Kribbella deserti]|uniref:Fibronectin type III domain-containing protein n=1 Tax=Kribbella deserti TaxID=1926257 RepID=A0ABV6QR62_9ACTN